MIKKLISILLTIIILITTLPLSNIKVYATIKDIKVNDFSYTGGVQSFTAPNTGMYRLEVWGAQGGGEAAGTGGYSSGYVTLQKGQTIYIQVGGQGGQGTIAEKNWGEDTKDSNTGIGGAGGYNGGGKGSDICHEWWPWDRVFGGYGGGGATSITLKNRGELSAFENYKNEVLIVAGGGGGCYASGGNGLGLVPGGRGGGLSGENGYAANGAEGIITNDPSTSISNPSHVAIGGTQTNGYKFGQGQNAATPPPMDGVTDGDGGGRRWLVWRNFKSKCMGT